MSKKFKQDSRMPNMDMVRETLKCRADMSEINSPPRIVQRPAGQEHKDAWWFQP